MPWNWQQSDWPHFSYDGSRLEPLERQFLQRSGELLGVLRHIDQDDQALLRIEVLSDEAVKTSAIEGELLDRSSVQSSLKRQFGLDPGSKRISPAERGIAEMTFDLYQHFADPLDHGTMFSWHRTLMAGRPGIDLLGGYRTHVEPMQIVSGEIGSPRVHFEAPPSPRVAAEMDAFVQWFNAAGPAGRNALPALTRAGLAHLYFESIHPFEDGNGRIGRALSEKALAQNLGQPSLIALSYTIERDRKSYYDMLETSSRNNSVTPWLVYFAETALKAQRTTLTRLEFSLVEAKFYRRLEGQFNERQKKAVDRMFRAGIDGFQGGLSAENYVSITGATRATATRDLQDLVAKQALTRTGERRHTRYALNIPTIGAIGVETEGRTS